jgi:hypothetical protein
MRGRFTNQRGLRPAPAIFCPSAQVSDDKTELTVFRPIGIAEASQSDQASFDLARAVAADAHPFCLSPSSCTQNGCALILGLAHPDPKAGCS